MRFKNISPLGALVVPALRVAPVRPDEVIEVEGETARALEADTVNWQAEKPEPPATKKPKE